MTKSRNVILSGAKDLKIACRDSSPSPRLRMTTSGFSMAELLVALLILTVVITTTIYMFTQRNQHLREANETILVFQVLANEAELWRRVKFADLDSHTTFMSETALLKAIEPFTTAVKIETPKPDIKQVTLTIRWQNGSKQAHLALVRADTGGANLW